MVALTNQFGTHQGDYLGMPPTGKKYEEPGHVLYRLHHGKIAEVRPIFDRLDIMEQLGIWPGAPTIGRRRTLGARRPGSRRLSPQAFPGCGLRL